jgi:hypothetical protein
MHVRGINFKAALANIVPIDEQSACGRRNWRDGQGLTDRGMSA